MRVYKVIGKYTGAEVLNVFANTMHGAKVWFTRNARMGVSSSYEFIGRDTTGVKLVPSSEEVKCFTILINGNLVTGARLEQIRSLNMYYVYLDTKYIGIVDFDRIQFTSESRTVTYDSVKDMFNTVVNIGIRKS